MTWLPFGREDMIKVNVTRTYDAPSALWSVAFEVVESRVGDINRFCFIKDSNTIWVASPCDDDGTPVYPAVNSDQVARTNKIKVTCDIESHVDETINGVLNDLDEYIRSKEALKDMVDAEVFVIRP